MIKLIASDIDGTLIPYGQTELPPALFGVIRRLRRRGIQFCAASGRQYHSVRDLFGPAADEICCLSENGAIVYGAGTPEGGPALCKSAIPRADALAICHAIADLPFCRVLISSENGAFTFGRGNDPDYLAYMRGPKRFHLDVVERPEDIPGELVKVSAYCPDGTEEPAAALGPRWGAAYHMAAAGPDWLDFMSADKGTGLRGLCGALGIELSEVMAFGDNWNDVPMLDIAGRARIMENAEPALLERFPNHCADVVAALEALLAEM